MKTKYYGKTRKDWARPALVPRNVAKFHKYFKHDQSGFESQKEFSVQVMPPHEAYCLLSNGPHYAHVAVFKREANR